MQTAENIVLEFERRDTQGPCVELIDGVELPKELAMTRHGLLEGEFVALLLPWARTRGIAGTEIRFWLAVDADRPTSLVPDVAFVSYERIALLAEFERQRLPFAPDLAVEIRSPGDRERNITRKTDLYLAYGSNVVLDIDPKLATIVARDRHGKRTYARRDRFAHPSLPALCFDVTAFFAAGEIARPS